VLEFLVGKGLSEMLIPLVAGVASLPLAGWLRLAQLLVGPINVLEAATRIHTTNRWRKDEVRLHDAVRSFRFHTLALAVPYVLLVLLLVRLCSETVSVLNGFPLILLAGVCLERIITVLSSSYAFGIRLTGRTLHVARIRVFTAGIILVCVVLGALGSTVSLALAFPISGVIVLAVWRTIAREYRPESEGV
jgi:hypothetical protein